MKINNLAIILGLGTLSVFGGMISANQVQAHHIDLGWRSNPKSMGLDRSENLGKEYNFECIPVPREESYLLSQTVYSNHLYGNGNYRSSSYICLAAVQMGLITKSGGHVTIKINPGKEFYPGLTRHGITSKDGGASDFSFSFVGKATANQTPSNASNSVQSPVPASPPAPYKRPSAIEEGVRTGVETGIEKGVQDALGDLF